MLSLTFSSFRRTSFYRKIGGSLEVTQSSTSVWCELRELMQQPDEMFSLPFFSPSAEHLKFSNQGLFGVGSFLHLQGWE